MSIIIMYECDVMCVCVCVCVGGGGGEGGGSARARKYSDHLLSCRIYVSSKFPINRLAYDGAHLVPMDYLSILISLKLLYLIDVK